MRVPQVDLARVGVLEVPAWLRGSLLEAYLTDLAPRLSGQVAIMDEAQALAAKQRLLASPFVAKVGLQRVFPDRFRAELSLREPRMEVYRLRDADVPSAEPIAYLDRDAVLMPPLGRLGLPRVLSAAKPGPESMGKQAEDDRLRAAVAVAIEWQEQVLPLCPVKTPPLVEVDASNLGYRMLGDQVFSEVQIGLARVGGKTAWLAYTHPPGSKWPRVAKEVLAGVMTAILEKHRGLEFVEHADLRFQKRWMDRVRLAPE